MTVELESGRVEVETIHMDVEDNVRIWGDKGFDRSKFQDEGPDHSTRTSIARLRSSIKGKGLQSPLIVRRHTSDEVTETGCLYRLVAGFRRYFAITGINPKAYQSGEYETKPLFDHVDVRILPSDSSELDVFEATLTENVQRENLSNAEMADALYRLRELSAQAGKKLTYEEIAKRMSLSKGHVSLMIKVRENLCQLCWDAFAEGHPKASVRFMYDIAKLEDEGQQKETWLRHIGKWEGPGDDSGEGEGEGEGGEEGKGNDDPKPEKPKLFGDGPAVSLKAYEAIEILDQETREHRKEAPASKKKSDDYYKGLLAGLRCVMHGNRPFSALPKPEPETDPEGEE